MNIQKLYWEGDSSRLVSSPDAVREILRDTRKKFYIVRDGNKIVFSNCGTLTSKPGKRECIASVPALDIKKLSGNSFTKAHRITYPYMVGAMAGGITSEETVIKMAGAGFIASYGAAGCSLQKLENIVSRLQKALPEGNFLINLIHNPTEPESEMKTVELFLRKRIRTIEASAFMDITPALVCFRAAGLEKDIDGRVIARNKIMAKISREEIAEKFMSPAPRILLNKLVAERLISKEQADLALQVPLADDVTAEADSGGHTDNRPFISLLPAIISLKERICARYKYNQAIRVGAAGGIGTPEAVYAAFGMGAEYVVAGSVHQACVESGTSDYVKELLSRISSTDVTMSPCADMFEIGAKVQVVKKDSLFAVRARKLFELYSTYNSVEEIPLPERDNIERTIFRKLLNEVWAETRDFFKKNNPAILGRAEENGKKKMALIFRWYLGKSSKWAVSNDKGRELDYQIWCGASMGAFNTWVKGTYLEMYQNRKSPDVALQLLQGAVYIHRIRILKSQNIKLPTGFNQYLPEAPQSVLKNLAVN